MDQMLLGESDSDNDDVIQVSRISPAPVAPNQPPPRHMPSQPMQQQPKQPSQAEISSRLKSLYSPANKAVPQQHALHKPVQPPPRSTPPSSMASQSLRSMPTPQSAPRASQPSMPPTAGAYHPPSRLPMPKNAMPLPQVTGRGGPPPVASSQPVRPLVPNRAPMKDPFEPTPLTTILQQRHPGTQVQSSGLPPGSVPPPPRSSSTVSSTSSTVRMSNPAASSAQRARLEKESKQRKEKFLMFTRVLMKYLEQKDPAMHARAKEVIRECAEKNKNKEKGYESVTASMQTRLRETVGDMYWKRAESYLNHYLKQKTEYEQRKKQQSDSSIHTMEKEKKEQEARKLKLQQQQHQQQKQQQQQKQKEAQQRLQEIRQSNKAQMEALKSQSQQQQQQQQKPQQQQQPQQTVQRRQASQSALSDPPKSKKQRKTSVPLSNPAQTQNSTQQQRVTQSTIQSTPTYKTVESKVPPKEYEEFMEMLDHSVNYDWTGAGFLLSSQKSDVNLQDEQRKLLYESPHKIPSSRGLVPGWSSRNLVSARMVWAKVRLPELEQCKREAEAAGRSFDASNFKSKWFNEDVAEKDTALAALSEGVDIYLKEVLSKALDCARQRENLQGIRLWHLQHTNNAGNLGLRLGCDVTRQIALKEGNAAKTVQRMEQALERENRAPQDRDLKNPETLARATSMADLACRPRLLSAVENASHHAKRCFEVSGGKDASAPPFGRVPKRPKLMAHDFAMGLTLSGVRRPRRVTFNFA